MHTVEYETRTLEDISKIWSTYSTTWNSDACTPSVDFTYKESEKPLLLLGDHEIPLSEDTCNRLCTFYGIPTAFFKRLTVEEKHYVLNARIDHTIGEVTITYNRWGLVDIRKPSQPRLEAEHYLAAARRVMSRHSEVIDAVLTPDVLHLDVLHPHASDGIQPGIRITQNRKANLSPVVSPLLHHTATSSLIHIPDASLRIDSRGQSVERIADLLAGLTLRADARLHTDTEAFLDLVNTPLGNDQERMTRLNRVAEEHKLPARSLAQVTAAVASTEEPNLQHLVLAIANAANAPALEEERKRGARTKLQAIAGAVVNDHAARCSKCYALAV